MCTFISDRSLSIYLLHTQVKGSNFTLLETYVIYVVCGSYFGDLIIIIIIMVIFKCYFSGELIALS